MVQTIKQGNIFGRVGSGIGRGLAEQLPKEVERGRLQYGLQSLENEQANRQQNKQSPLTPFQQFTRYAALPGMTPQMQQTTGDLLRQQAYLDAVKNQYSGSGKDNGYSPTPEERDFRPKGEIPTLATPEDTTQSYKNYKPPTIQEQNANAHENFKKYPARYNFNFKEAQEEQNQITQRNRDIQQAHKDQEKTAVDKEAQIKQALSAEIDKLGLNSIPPKAKQKFEEKILQSMLPVSEEGQGLTQEQAVKQHSKEMDQADRNYKDLGSLSAWSPADFNRRANALQKEFASRGEQQQMMDQMISDYQVDPLYAAHKAYPIKNGEIKTLNKLPNAINAGGVNLNNSDYARMKKEMGKTHSPLSIAYELERKRQNPSAWLKYLDDHKDDLEVWQADQLNKNIDPFNLQSIWLRQWE